MQDGEISNHLSGRQDPLVVPCEDLAAVLNDWRVRYERSHPPWQNSYPMHNMHFGYVNYLSDESGIHDRRIRSIMNLEQQFVTFRIAEALLMAIDREYMLKTGEVPLLPNPQWSMERWLEWREQERGECA